MNRTSRAFEIREDGGEVAGLFEDRAGRAADRHLQLVRDDVRERGLAQAGRAVEQHVIERLATLTRGGDRDVQVLADAILPDVVVQRARPQAGFGTGVPHRSATR